MVAKASARNSVAWVGLGKMGAPMARNLLKSGRPLGVFNRNPEKAAPLVGEGATLHQSLADLAGVSGVVFSMVADDRALHDVALAKAGVLQHMTAGSIYVEMSTVSPAISSVIADLCQKRGIAYLRAPVSGSTVLAAAGGLTILVSGPRKAFDECQDLLGLLGKKLYYVGDEDQARFLKLSINLMVGITSAMMAEALTLSRKGNVSWVEMIDIINNSVVGSPLVGYKAEMLKRRDFTPMFEASQMAKDFDLALDTARTSHVSLPVTALVRQLWEGMIATGRGDMDFFGYVTLMEELAGLSANDVSTGR